MSSSSSAGRSPNFSADSVTMLARFSLTGSSPGWNRTLTSRRLLFPPLRDGSNAVLGPVHPGLHEGDYSEVAAHDGALAARDGLVAQHQGERAARHRHGCLHPLLGRVGGHGHAGAVAGAEVPGLGLL